MTYKFRAVEQPDYLLPPSLEEWLPEDHLARFVVDIVKSLDLKELEEPYAGCGSQPYHPATLLALLFYGYATGVFSSRKIETATYDSVAFRFIAANQHPDHSTIADFRKRFLPQLGALFVQILAIAHEMGLLKLGTISLDGTKVKANASKHKALSWDHANKLEQQLKAEVEQLMQMAKKADEEEASDEMNIPEELARREQRLEKIAQAKAEIQARAKARYEQEKAEYEQKVARREDVERKTGKKPRGKAPKPPSPEPQGKDQVNLTDGDSRIMPGPGKEFNQSYNCQGAVEIDSMLIVEDHVSQSPNDKQELKPALENVDKLPEQLGKTDGALIDSGYYSKTNVDECEARGITPYIPGERQPHHPTLEQRFSEPAEIPEDADSMSKMKHRMATSEGKKLYAKRKSTIEPVFGIIKHVMGFRQFLLRGHKAVQGEWNLVCIAFNLKRMHTLTG
jgi:transposase